MAETNSKEKILVAGGGLVGALAASVFADQGHKVDLYELRGDPRAAGADTGWELRSVSCWIPLISYQDRGPSPIPGPGPIFGP